MVIKKNSVYIMLSMSLCVRKNCLIFALFSDASLVRLERAEFDFTPFYLENQDSTETQRCNQHKCDQRAIYCLHFEDTDWQYFCKTHANNSSYIKPTKELSIKKLRKAKAKAGQLAKLSRKFGLADEDELRTLHNQTEQATLDIFFARLERYLNANVMRLVHQEKRHFSLYETARAMNDVLAKLAPIFTNTDLTRITIEDSPSHVLSHHLSPLNYMLMQFCLERRPDVEPQIVSHDRMRQRLKKKAPERYTCSWKQIDETMLLSHAAVIYGLEARLEREVELSEAICLLQAW